MNELISKSQPPWVVMPGMQTKLLQTNATEILVGGDYGSGKTTGGIFWLVKGNHDLPEDHACRSTALNYSKYRALVLLPNAGSLRGWVDQAWEVFKHTGAIASGKPVMFHWATGAKIYTDVLSEDTASRYRGWNLDRILIENLTDIPTVDEYLKLMLPLRSKVDADGLLAVKPQICSLTSPKGPGHEWVKRRFVTVRSNGAEVPPGTPFVDHLGGPTRIFLTSGIESNRFLDPAYAARLAQHESASESLCRAWNLGDNVLA